MTTAARTTQPYSALSARGSARLTVVSGPCPEGLAFGIAGASASIGRGAVEVPLTEDAEVSPSHAVVQVSGGRVTVKDNASANGVYLRVRVPSVIEDGAWFRTGDQYFRFHTLQQAEQYPAPDGTLLFVSPRRKGTFRVQQMLAGGHLGLSSTTSNDELTIGGEGSGVAFSSDAHLSARHARVFRAPNGSYMLEDTGSTNGTFVRVRGEAPLTDGDMIFVGATLLRVDLN